MDRLDEHAMIVRRLVERHADLLRRSDGGGVESALMVDPEGRRFLLFETGWANGKRVNNTYLHVHLKNGRIWIEEDWTEDGLATELVRAGVPKEDIVLGFQPPERRHLTDFAVA